MDIELAQQTATSAFRRRLAVLVAVAALAAALLGTLEAYAGAREEHALVRANHASIDITLGITASSVRRGFEANGVRDALVTGLAGTGRFAEIPDPGTAADISLALSQAESQASDRIIELAGQMAQLPRDAPVDPVTRRAATAEISELNALVEAQNHQVDLAGRYGSRQERAMFGLAMVAIAAVLLGLAGLMGNSRTARVSLVVAALALLLAIGWGASGLL